MSQMKEFIEGMPILKGSSGFLVTSFQVLVISTSFKTEMMEKTRSKYSKFVEKETKDITTVLSRTGMLVIYTPALIVACVSNFMSILSSASSHCNVGSLFCFLHFLKRDFEVLYLHKYSGRIPLPTSIQIGVFYALVTLLVCSVSTTIPSESSKIVGTFLFIFGEMGNLYHHYLLANLRSAVNFTDNKSSKEYVAPRGGLFEYVATPHYFFELIAWYGISIVSHHANVYLVAAGMTSYLSGRAFSQNEWNKRMFDKKEWPPSRKNIVPFLF